MNQKNEANTHASTNNSGANNKSMRDDNNEVNYDEVSGDQDKQDQHNSKLVDANNATPMNGNLASIEENLRLCQEQIVQLKEENLRLLADMQNQQRRNNDELKKARDYAIGSFAKDVIIIRDYLEMALMDNSQDVQNIKTGVELTLKQLLQVFERHLIKEINPAPNDKLDPNLHQAVQSLEAEGVSPNGVVAVMQKGYILKERVLRPATVTVAK